MKNHYLFLILLSVVVLGTAVYGFMDGGSPRATLNNRNDLTRYQDIQTLSNGVKNYYKNFRELPQITYALTAGSSGLSEIPTDPETKSAYNYKILSSTDFELCATFATDTRNSQNNTDSQNHPSGYYCYKFQASF